jgi:hypothetical protein
MSTSQHSGPNDIVTLYENGKVIAKGVAKELREKYEDLRTVQETYVLLPDGELAILIAKGSALGSKTRDEPLPTFYKYMQDMVKEGGVFAHTTILNGVLEKGAKNFYTMTFTKGRETTNAEKLSVLEHSDKLTEIITQYDAENAKMEINQKPSVADDSGEEAVEDKPF